MERKLRTAAILLSKWLLLLLLITSWGIARAEYVDPIGYNYGITIPGNTTETIYATPQQAAEAFIAGGNAYYARDPGITYTLLRVYPCSEARPPTSYSCNSINWYLDWHFSSPTDQTDYNGWWINTHIICPPGYISGTAYNKCWRSTPPPPPPPPPVKLSLVPGAPSIPQGSVVVAGKVLTKANVVATVLERNAAAAGKTVTLTSNRPANVDLITPAASLTTDSAGKAAAAVSTRSQPGTSTLSGTTSGLTTPTIANVSWLPAKYEAQFLVTCYTIANEALEAEKPASSGVCGLPEKQSYRDAFLRDVKMQGSGVALDGTTIHYAGRGCYNTDTCARTATGACAVVGSTIAVDPNIIPKRSTVDVKIIGSRNAQDTGGRITGYHIDEYLGPQPKLCKQLGLRTSDVSLLNY
jgi:3D (Asp-Asp-Asp) domain-containing protein